MVRGRGQPALSRQEYGDLGGRPVLALESPCPADGDTPCLLTLQPPVPHIFKFSFYMSTSSTTF